MALAVAVVAAASGAPPTPKVLHMTRDGVFFMDKPSSHIHNRKRKLAKRASSLQKRRRKR